ncbi:MAG: hypothetical protein JNM32_10120 [Dechloromonas sp.]|nr:hypothetical protein [Dechloromonas sp.]
MNTNLECSRRKIAPPLEIENTNLGAEAMRGFHDGYALAASKLEIEITQPALDFLGSILDSSDDPDYSIGKLLGYMRYYEELIRHIPESAA